MNHASRHQVVVRSRLRAADESGAVLALCQDPEQTVFFTRRVKHTKTREPSMTALLPILWYSGTSTSDPGAVKH